MIVVPPELGPAPGETNAIVGAGEYVNALLAMAVPPIVVTLTLVVPAAPAGVTAVSVVVFTTVTLCAGTPPNPTFVAPTR